MLHTFQPTEKDLLFNFAGNIFPKHHTAVWSSCSEETFCESHETKGHCQKKAVHWLHWNHMQEVAEISLFIDKTLRFGGSMTMFALTYSPLWLGYWRVLLMQQSANSADLNLCDAWLKKHLNFANPSAGRTLQVCRTLYQVTVIVS